MKAEFDLNKCSGHARCFLVDPELFDIDDSGYALNAEVDIPAGDEGKAHEAVAACPERAIALR
ncbi:ferredoxin [Williamsia sp.]|uniref:ferredoxin n=1 Tax=Williamsia sp. TaxID=1872085 RepID=UPI002F937689